MSDLREWREWREAGVLFLAEDGRAVARPPPPRREVGQDGIEKDVKCPFCGGSGQGTVTREGVVRYARCRCQRLPDRVALYNDVGIPGRYLNATFESFRGDLPGAQVGLRASKAWAEKYERGGKGLLLSGGPGRGKTHLLCAILRELVFRYGVPCRFVEFTHLISSIKEGFDLKQPEATTLTPLVKVPVLAIDELGKGRKTEFEQAILDELVSRRYNAGGTLLATTNYELRRRDGEVARPGSAENLAVPGNEILPERLGERVYSRLLETMVMSPVIGDDYRLGRR